MVYIIVFGNFLGYRYVDSLVIIFISTVLPLLLDTSSNADGIINSLNKFFIIIIVLLCSFPKFKYSKLNIFIAICCKL